MTEQDAINLLRQYRDQLKVPATILTGVVGFRIYADDESDIDPLLPIILLLGVRITEKKMIEKNVKDSYEFMMRLEL